MSDYTKDPEYQAMLARLRGPLSGWTDRELADELAYQTPTGATTVSTGRCGHPSRGGWPCADCLRAEIERRKA